jgi:hypothetical protein
MAHFAKLDENNMVVDITGVDNIWLDGKDYPEADEIGSAYLNAHGFEGRWIQTSYTSSFRKNFAAIGHIYNEENDCFYLEEKAHEEMIWDADNWRWVPPSA